MTVRSFAQNFEDVLLWRALRHVPDGRYVDVGAGHPDLHSVTRLFYDAGWSGINIEPLPELVADLRRERPRDVTVHAAVSTADSGVVELTVVEQWDELSTIVPQRVEQLRDEGRRLSTVSVPAVRLDDVLAEHGPGEVHFLKIDVEGAELDVLQTLDLDRTRPWIVVVEVVAAGETSGSREAIERHLGTHRYLHAYFDGLNDHFVAEERADELLPHFAVPVNVTDDFIVASTGDRAVLGLLARKLGLPEVAQTSEVLQRVEALVHDRIDFESRFRELEAAGQAADDATGQTPLAELRERVEVQERTIRSLKLKNEAMEQSSFERERMIAWYAAEVSNHRRRWHEQEQRIAGHVERETVLTASVHDTEARLKDVLGSTSWRTTLPMRVVRRPRIYLRKLSNGGAGQ